LYTSPGTETKVIPEMATPIIPYETKNHGAFLPAIKKVSELAFLDVICDIRYKRIT
jgi:hypothetical protein